MADPERTARLRALLVRLRSVREVDALSVRDPEPVDGFFDIYFVTHKKIAVSCTELLKECGDQPFRADLRLLRSVLERESNNVFDKHHGADGRVSKSKNVQITGLLWRRMQPALQAFHKTTKPGSAAWSAVNKLDDQMKAYRNKHREDFDKQHNYARVDELLSGLPDINTLPD
jgi:hypothetical protein